MAKTCRRRTMSGSRSISTATSASASTSPGRTTISTAPCSSGRRSMTTFPATPTRSCSPMGVRPGTPPQVKSKGFSTLRSISLVWNTTSASSSTPRPARLTSVSRTSRRFSRQEQSQPVGSGQHSVPRCSIRRFPASRVRLPIQRSQSPRTWCSSCHPRVSHRRMVR